MRPECPCMDKGLNLPDPCPCACHPADARCNWKHDHDDRGQCLPVAIEAGRDD